MKLTKEMVEVQGKSVVYHRSDSDSVSSLFDNTGIEKVLERHAPEIFVVSLDDHNEKVVFLATSALETINPVHEVGFLGEDLGPAWGYRGFTTTGRAARHTDAKDYRLSAPYRCRAYRGKKEIDEILLDFLKIREGRTEIGYTIYLLQSDPVKPAWASDCGEDEFGSWAEFEFKGVTQRLRWIEPGSFFMGAPESESKPYNDEGPQHEVTLTQGFWMFDTAVTQALWVAVMGDNPSRFKDPDRPVENVSWHDANVFIRKVNDILPGLELGLPTEAQWEYACRAGTQTPFYFGDTITSEQVNYNGEHPYGSGLKGLYREETVAVKSLPPNAWGLYEMHGNVWEWCEDYWGYYSAEAQTDPTGPSSGDSRVFRGGSWRFGADAVRAAFRNYDDPDLRHELGFRCIQVQY